MTMKWTFAADDALRAAWGKERVQNIARRLGTTEKGARLRAAHLGIKMQTSGTPRAQPLANRSGRPWSIEDDKILRTCWGDFVPKTICARLGRGPRAVRDRAKKIGLPQARQGRIALQRLTKEGYNLKRLKNAMTALGINPEPTPSPHRRKKAVPQRWLNDDQADELIIYLATIPDGLRVYPDGKPMHPNTVWGVNGRPVACLSHGGTDIPHAANGLCKRCHAREWARKKRGSAPMHPNTVWGVRGRPVACLSHGGTDVPHGSKGLCTRCRAREWAHKNRMKKKAA